MKSALSPVVMLLAVAACQPSAETPDQAQARMDTESAAAKMAIDSMAGEFATHFNAGHADIVAGFYMENATAMPPNAPMASGRAAIQAVLQGFVDMKAQLTLTPQAVVANGPLAIERGVYSVTFTPPGATAPMTDTGKYLVHWHMVDGKWMIADDIWNSDLAPPPPPPAR
ncbi:MAG: YybH family protein [Gemmatimonadales bacterium]